MKKNGCSRFKLILCCFLPNISPYTKFHPNWKENTEVENCQQVRRFWLVGLLGKKIVVGIYNIFYVVFGTLLASIPNIIQIGQKTQS